MPLAPKRPCVEAKGFVVAVMAASLVYGLS